MADIERRRFLVFTSASLTALSGCLSESEKQPSEEESENDSTEYVRVDDPEPTPDPEVEDIVDTSDYEDMFGGGDIDELSADEIREIIHEKVNVRRREMGVSELRYSTSIESIAQNKASMMAKHEYLDHTDIHGNSTNDRLRGTCSINGENLAKTTVTTNNLEVAEEVVDGWMDSQSHRENIVRDIFDNQGIGVAMSDSAVYIALNFCR